MRIIQGVVILLCLSFSSVILADSEIYRTTDSEGNVHFSDKPSAGAEKVKLSPTQTYTPAIPKHETIEREMGIEKKHHHPDYSALKIIEPRQNETFRDPSKPISLKVEGVELSPKHQFILSVDTPENQVGTPFTSDSINVHDLVRGDHSLFVSVIDDKGTIVYTTEPVSVHIHWPTTRISQNH